LRNIHTVALVLVILLALIPSAFSDTVDATEAICHIQAANIDCDTDGDRFVAEPNVRITYNDLVLTADRVEGSAKSGDVVAAGNVVFQSKERSLHSDSFHFNMKTGVGSADSASATMNGVYFTGKEMQMAQKTLKIVSSRLTGCNAVHPHYYLSAKEMDITPGKEVVAQRVSVVLYGKTIASIPRLKFGLGEHSERSEVAIPPINFSRNYGLIVGREFDISNGFTAGGFALALSTNRLFQTGLFYDRIGSSPFYARATYHMPAYHGTRPDTLVTRLPEIGMRFCVGDSAKSYATTRRAIDLATGDTGAFPPWHSPGKLNFISETGLGYFVEEPSWAKSGRFDTRFVAWANPIPLDSKTSICPGIMGRFSQYGNGNRYGIAGLRLTLGRKLNKRTSLEISYAARAVSGSTPFDFDRNELTSEVSALLKFPVGPFTFGVGPRYDLHSRGLYDIQYSVARQFHCIEPSIGLNSRFQQLTFGLSLVGL